MPVVIADPAAWQAWLDPALDGEAVSELLVPLAPELLRVGPANPVMNSGKHEGPDCLDMSAAAWPAAA
jgi:putative SOS response-associated peptidase YedK